MSLIDKFFRKKVNTEKEKEKLQTKKLEINQDDFKKSLKIKDKNKKSKKKLSQEEYLKREKRVKNYYLKRVATGIKDDGKFYEEYDGINISKGEHRGEILRIRDLEIEKIDKEKSGSYLYLGYIGNTLEEDVNIDFDYWSMTNLSEIMIPVCFELYRSLDDIVQTGDKEEIKAFLELISEPQNFIDNNRLKFLGSLELKTEINELGEIIRKPVINRSAYSKSPSIDAKVDRMQKIYALKQKSNDGERR